MVDETVSAEEVPVGDERGFETSVFPEEGPAPAEVAIQPSVDTDHEVTRSAPADP